MIDNGKRTMDRQTFEDELRRDGYEVFGSTTPGAKTNPDHSHPFDARVLVVEGALTLRTQGTLRTYRAGEHFSMMRGCVHSESYGPEGAVTVVGRRM